MCYRPEGASEIRELGDKVMRRTGLRRRGSEEELRGGEALDNLHGSPQSGRCHGE